VADQLVELLAVAALGELEDRRVWGGQRPQRAGIAGGPPTSLIDMERGLAENPVAQLAVRVGERG
jgi:hypothetical protein